MRGIIVLFLFLFSLSVNGQMVIDSYRFGAAAPADLLLDSFPSAGGAWSLRKLDKDYAGNCIMVVRTNGDSTDVGFAGNFLDTVALKTFCGTGGTDSCTVRVWYDQSGNTLNVRQNTRANQPSILSAGVIRRDNGNVALRFWGSGDELETAATAFNAGGFLSAFAYIGDHTSVSNDFFGNRDAASLGGWAYLYRISASRYLAANITFNTQTYTVTKFSRHLISILRASNNSFETYYNNALQGTAGGTNGHSTAGSVFAIGSDGNSGGFTNGFIHEVIIYASDQSANRAAISTNINNFYQIY